MRVPAAVVAFVAAVAVLPAARAEEAPARPEAAWAADFDAAVEQARKERKDLLVDFTGSDWCGWCIKLHEEVFAHEDFLAAARKDYVLVALDFPRDEAVKAKVPNPARNAELARKYGVAGYPTVLLMTPEGEVFGQTGYQAGGSSKYVEHIGKLRSEGVPELKAARDLVALIKAARGADLSAACEKAVAGLAALPEGSGLGVVRVLPVRAAFAADPGNKAGIAARAVGALLKAGFADAEALAAAEKFDPKNELGLLEHAVAAKAGTLRNLDDVKAFVKSCEDLFALGEPKDGKVARQLAANCMFMNHQHLKDAEKAKAWAKRVKAMGFAPGDERLQALVEKVLGAEDPPADGK